MFLVEVTIKDRSLAQPHLAGHMEFLKSHNNQKEILLYGASSDGRLMVVSTDDIRDLERLLQMDPLYTARICDYRITEFKYGSKQVLVRDY